MTLHPSTLKRDQRSRKPSLSLEQVGRGGAAVTGRGMWLGWHPCNWTREGHARPCPAWLHGVPPSPAPPPTAQHSSAKPSPVQPRPTQSSPVQYSSAQPSPARTSCAESTQCSPPHISPAQHSPAPPRATHTRTAQLRQAWPSQAQPSAAVPGSAQPSAPYSPKVIPLPPKLQQQALKYFNILFSLYRNPTPPPLCPSNGKWPPVDGTNT